MPFPEPDQVDCNFFYAFLQIPKVSSGPPGWQRILIPEYPPDKSWKEEKVGLLELGIKREQVVCGGKGKIHGGGDLEGWLPQRWVWEGHSRVKEQ